MAGAAIRSLVPVFPRRHPPRDPIFIVGSPRSGTSVLFEVLDRSSALASLHGESHFLWELFHASSSPDWTSHQVLPAEISRKERRAIYWMIDAISVDRRYLDKSPRNSLRLAYLHAMFPTAWFVFLKRDGRAAVSSLITGWRSDDPRFPGTRVPIALAIDGYGGQNWKYLVPPGWETYVTGHSITEVCAFQWVAANEAILSAKQEIDPARWVEVRYEDLVRSPIEEAGQLLSRLGLPQDGRVLEYAHGLDRHVTRAVTPPREGKWQDENAGEIEKVLTTIGPLMRRLGYDPEE